MDIVIVAADTIIGEILARQCQAALSGARIRQHSADEILADQRPQESIDLIIYAEEDAGLAHEFLQTQAQRHRPVILAGGGQTAETRLQAIRLGAAEYLAYEQFWPELTARVVHYVLENAALQRRNRDLHARNEFLQSHDGLTRCRNRSSFYGDLAEATEEALSQNQQLAIGLIGLDSFRKINDSLGQQAGDTALKVLAQRIKHVLREEDTLYRIDGNQFAVLLNQSTTEASVTQAAQRILAVVDRPLSIYTQEVQCLASIGVARWPGDGDCVEALVTAADAAMRAARSGGGGVRVVDPSMVPPRLSGQTDSSLIRH